MVVETCMHEDQLRRRDRDRGEQKVREGYVRVWRSSRSAAEEGMNTTFPVIVARPRSRNNMDRH